MKYRDNSGEDKELLFTQEHPSWTTFLPSPGGDCLLSGASVPTGRRSEPGSDSPRAQAAAKENGFTLTLADTAVVAASVASSVTEETERIPSCPTPPPAVCPVQTVALCLVPRLPDGMPADPWDAGLSVQYRPPPLYHLNSGYRVINLPIRSASSNVPSPSSLFITSTRLQVEVPFYPKQLIQSSASKNQSLFL
ncbi:unnamed protein product [Pleuronectes platessa]|uniref:Uncharacterized protein n=1 Tax=Pleuronectes platessa TaxID=8262 RepID=A0A9N7U7F7_PLEPL|nr:unnamed protein product [Pleuronectes platessa]